MDNTFSGEAADRCGFLLVFHVWVMAPRRRWMAFLEPANDASSGRSAWAAVCDASRDDDREELIGEPFRADELIVDLVDTALDTVDFRDDPESVYEL